MRGYIDYENLNEELKLKIDTAGGGGTFNFVRTVNRVEPDNDGNVETTFQVIDVIQADVNWNSGEYPEGVSEFYSTYDKNNYAQYILDNPSFDILPNGKIAVRTFINTTESSAIQNIDSIRDGIFEASYVRVGNDDGTWGELKPVAGRKSHDYLLNDPAYCATTVATNTLYNDLTSDLETHSEKVASTSQLGHVMVDGTTITVDGTGKISAIGGGQATPLSDQWDLNDPTIASSTKATYELGNSIQTALSTVESNLEATNDALAVETGKINNLTTTVNDLNDAIDSMSGMEQDLSNHEQLKASDTQLGHVRPDGITITADVNGIITAIAAPTTWGSF